MSAKTLLAVDFSTSFRSIAVMDLGTGKVLAQTNTRPCPGDGKGICSHVNKLLEQAGLDNKEVQALAVGVGPGSYTGIRAAIAFAQGWHLAQGVRLIAINTADALALRAIELGWKGLIHILIDAQRNEYYHASYQLLPSDQPIASQGLFPKNVTPLKIINLEAVQQLLQKTPFVCGPDLEKPLPQIQNLYPRAEEIAKLALRFEGKVEPEDLVPIYLRPTEFVKVASFRPLPL